MNEPMVTVVGYLVIEKGGRYPLDGRARWTVNQPNVKRGEVAVRVKAQVPRRMFEQPTYHIDLTVTEPDEPVTTEVVGAALRTAWIIASITELPNLEAERREEMIDDQYQAARE